MTWGRRIVNNNVDVRVCGDVNALRLEILLADLMVLENKVCSEKPLTRFFLIRWSNGNVQCEVYERDVIEVERNWRGDGLRKWPH